MKDFWHVYCYIGWSDVGVSGWKLSGWSNYAECLTHGDKEDSVKKWFFLVCPYISPCLVQWQSDMHWHTTSKLNASPLYVFISLQWNKLAVCLRHDCLWLQQFSLCCGSANMLLRITRIYSIHYSPLLLNFAVSGLKKSNSWLNVDQPRSLTLISLTVRCFLFPVSFTH
jgi:hypothetical protein